MRFYLNATPTLQNSVPNGVFLKSYNDGYTKENFTIKFDGEIIYDAKGWEMPTNRIFISQKGNKIVFSESRYMINGNPIVDFSEANLKMNYKTYLSYLNAEWQEAYDCSFDELSNHEVNDLVNELKNVNALSLLPFADNAFTFSESNRFEKRKITFIHERLADGKNDDANNIPINWICDDGLLLSGEQPTEEEIKAFNKKINWSSQNSNGGLNGRYRD